MRLPRESEHHTLAAYTRFFYASQLLNFPLSDVRRFWRRLPLEHEGQLLSERELYEHIWDERNSVSTEYISHVQFAFERFLLEQGHEPDKFLQAAHAARFLYEPATLIAWFSNRLARLLMASRDVRAALAKRAPQVVNAIMPGAFSACVRHRHLPAKQMEALFCFAPDRTFGHDWGPWPDGELFVGPVFQYFPSRFGGQPFDKLDMLAEMEAAEARFTPKTEVRMEGDSLYVGKARYGTFMRFSAFLSHHDLHIPLPHLPDPRVLVAEREWYNEERRRHTLRPGCAYGAPLYLYSLFYTEGAPQRQPLAALIEELRSPEDSVYRKLERKHREMLATFEQPLRLEYSAALDTLTCDGAFITRGTQARLLLRILDNYLTHGKEEFVWSELAADPDLIVHPLSTGLSTRLHRVIAAVGRTCPGLRIRKVGKGRYRVEAEREVELRRV